MPTKYARFADHAFGLRLQALRFAIGLASHGDKSKLADALGIKLSRLSWWFARSTPKTKVLAECIARLALVHPVITDTEGTWKWLLHGGPPPLWLATASEERQREMVGAYTHPEHEVSPPTSRVAPAFMHPDIDINEKPDSPAIPLVEAALAGRADPMQTLRIVHAILKAGLAAMALALIVTPRTAEATGTLPDGWRVHDGGGLASARPATETVTPQEDEMSSPVNSKKWMPRFFDERAA